MEYTLGERRSENCMSNLKKKNGALFLAAALCLVMMLLFSSNVEAKRKKVVKKRSPIIKKTLYVGSKTAAKVKISNARNSKKTIWRVVTKSKCINKIALNKNSIQFYASKTRAGKYEVCAFKVIKKTKKEFPFGNYFSIIKSITIMNSACAKAETL